MPGVYDGGFMPMGDTEDQKRLKNTRAWQARKRFLQAQGMASWPPGPLVTPTLEQVDPWLAEDVDRALKVVDEMLATPWPSSLSPAGRGYGRDF